MSEEIIVEVREVIQVVTEGIQGPPGPPGAPGNASSVVGETPSGAVNSSNATFTSAFNFIPESVAVFVNGLAQRRITDFNTSGQNTIIFSESPQTGDSIRVNYLRS